MPSAVCQNFKFDGESSMNFFESPNIKKPYSISDFFCINICKIKITQKPILCFLSILLCVLSVKLFGRQNISPTFALVNNIVNKYVLPILKPYCVPPHGICCNLNLAYGKKTTSQKTSRIFAH